MPPPWHTTNLSNFPYFVSCVCVCVKDCVRLSRLFDPIVRKSLAKFLFCRCFFVPKHFCNGVLCNITHWFRSVTRFVLTCRSKEETPASVPVHGHGYVQFIHIRSTVQGNKKPNERTASKFITNWMSNKAECSYKSDNTLNLKEKLSKRIVVAVVFVAAVAAHELKSGRWSCEFGKSAFAQSETSMQ